MREVIPAQLSASPRGAVADIFPGSLHYFSGFSPALATTRARRLKISQEILSLVGAGTAIPSPDAVNCSAEQRLASSHIISQ